MNSKTRDNSVKVVTNAKISSYLLRCGHKIVNIKKYRSFRCPVTNTICRYRTAFTFEASDEFWQDYFYAKEKYNEL